MSETPQPLERLEDSRARLRQWLEHDRMSPDASPLGESVRNTLPFLNAVWSHPATAMMLGAVAKSWCRTDPEAHGRGRIGPFELGSGLGQTTPKSRRARGGCGRWSGGLLAQPTAQKRPHAVDDVIEPMRGRAGCQAMLDENAQQVCAAAHSRRPNPPSN